MRSKWLSSRATDLRKPNMSHEFNPKQKFRIVKIELLVPQGDDSFCDLLSDYRDDYPDQLVEWGRHGDDVENMTAERAKVAWKVLHDEDVTITVAKE